MLQRPRVKLLKIWPQAPEIAAFSISSPDSRMLTRQAPQDLATRSKDCGFWDLEPRRVKLHKTWPQDLPTQESICLSRSRGAATLACLTFRDGVPV